MHQEKRICARAHHQAPPRHTPALSAEHPGLGVGCSSLAMGITCTRVMNKKNKNKIDWHRISYAMSTVALTLNYKLGSHR